MKLLPLAQERVAKEVQTKLCSTAILDRIQTEI